MSGLTWKQVLNHVEEHGSLYYKAPMDRYAQHVSARVSLGRPLRIRITPPSSDADPFWADEGHLGRITLERA